VENPIHQPILSESEDSINLWEIVDWLLAGWKMLVAGALIGLLGAIFYFFNSVPFQVKTTIINNGAIDFVTWRGLKEGLPILAGKVVEKDALSPSETTSILKKIRSPLWWDKNFRPVYAVTKADSKDMLPQSTDLRELGATKIINFSMTSRGVSAQNALHNAQIESAFFITGATYYSLRSLIKGYESTIDVDEVTIFKSISDAEVNLTLLNKRKKSLSEIAARYKGQQVSSASIQNIGAGNQTIAANAANSKFLPINSQLIALDLDIDQQIQLLELSRSQLAQVDFLKSYLIEARKILNQSYDGVDLTRQAIEALAISKQSLSKDNIYALQKANAVYLDLTNILNGYNKTLDINISPNPRRGGMLKVFIQGIALGFFLALFYLFSKYILVRYEQYRSSIRSAVI
jgi:hypothetical protein